MGEFLDLQGPARFQELQGKMRPVRVPQRLRLLPGAGRRGVRRLHGRGTVLQLRADPLTKNGSVKSPSALLRSSRNAQRTYRYASRPAPRAPCIWSFSRSLIMFLQTNKGNPERLPLFHSYKSSDPIPDHCSPVPVYHCSRSSPTSSISSVSSFSVSSLRLKWTTSQ